MCVSVQKRATNDAESVPAAAAAAAANDIPKVIAHVTDTVSGRPAEGLAVKLYRKEQSGTWSHIADG